MSASSAIWRQRILVSGYHLIALALLALQAIVRTYPPTPTSIPEEGSPEALWWGIWPITYVPTWVLALTTIGIIALIIYLWWRELFHTASSVESRSRPVWGWLIAISVLLSMAFLAFPIVHTRWGDSYIISRTLAWPTEDFRLTHTWQAPLDVFLHSRFWLTLDALREYEDATIVYRILSPVAGVIFLAALLMLSRFEDYATSWVTYGLVATLGVMQLFFGYVENYSFAAAFVMVYLWLGITSLLQRGRIWPAATALALANAFHPSTIVLLPSLVVFAWVSLDRSRHHGNNRNRSVVLQTVVPLALIYGMTWLMMEVGDHGLSTLFTSDRPGGGDARWLVPLRQTTTEWERYTMFSWPHLRDFVNEQLLIAPVVLPGIVLATFAYVSARINSAREDDSVGKAAHETCVPVLPFLITATASYLIFIWMWNPDYGGQRDWDLFSLAAISEALLLAYLLMRVLSPWRYVRMAALPLIAVQGVHTAAWIYQNTLPWIWP